MSRRKLARFTSFSAWLMILLGTSMAAGYTRALGPHSGQPVRWQSRLQLSLASEPTPPALEQPGVSKALESAIEAWSKAASDCAPLVRGVAPSAERRVADDGTNLVVFRTQEWCRNEVKRPGSCYDARRAAVTTLHFGRDDAGHEYVSGADIEINAVHFAWRTGAASSASDSRLDLRSTLMHELGHALGLGHPCQGPGEPARAFITEQGAPLAPCDSATLSGTASVMLPSAELASTITGPTNDDVRGVCAIYPGARKHERVATRSSGCGCALGSQGWGRWWCVVLTLLAVRVYQARARSARSKRNAG